MWFVSIDRLEAWLAMNSNSILLSKNLCVGTYQSRSSWGSGSPRCCPDSGSPAVSGCWCWWTGWMVPGRRASPFLVHPVLSSEEGSQNLPAPPTPSHLRRKTCRKKRVRNFHLHAKDLSAIPFPSLPLWANGVKPSAVYDTVWCVEEATFTGLTWQTDLWAFPGRWGRGADT